MSIERTPKTELFDHRLQEIATLYQNAFAGFPWFETLSLDETLKRISIDRKKPNFESFFAEDPNGKIIGALWFYSLSTEEIKIARGLDLSNYATSLCQKENPEVIIWESELMTDPPWQKQGIATRLRATMLPYLAEKYPRGALLFTRLREDNIGTIKSADRFGYLKTSVKKQSSQDPNLYHEYWYKLIKK